MNSHGNSDRTVILNYGRGFGYKSRCERKIGSFGADRRWSFDNDSRQYGTQRIATESRLDIVDIRMIDDGFKGFQERDGTFLLT